MTGDEDDQRSPFWIDYEYDKDRASNGYSRYAHYLDSDADRAFADIWGDDPTAEFAAIAWRFANGPIMAPGYVSSHARISNAQIERSDYSGTKMIARVALVAPTPRELHSARPVDGGWFHTPERDSWANAYYGPSSQDLERYAFLSTTTGVEWSFEVGRLPKITAVPAAGRARYQAARACVEEIATILNRQITPMIEAIDN